MTIFHILYSKIKVLNFFMDASKYKEMEEFYFSEVKTYNDNYVDEGGHLVIKDLKVMSMYQEIV